MTIGKGSMSTKFVCFRTLFSAMSNEGTIRLRNNSYKRVLDQGFQRRRQNKSVLGAATFDLSNESVYDESFVRKISLEISRGSSSK